MGLMIWIRRGEWMDDGAKLVWSRYTGSDFEVAVRIGCGYLRQCEGESPLACCDGKLVRCKLL